MAVKREKRGDEMDSVRIRSDLGGGRVSGQCLEWLLGIVFKPNFCHVYVFCSVHVWPTFVYEQLKGHLTITKTYELLQPLDLKHL